MALPKHRVWLASMAVVVGVVSAAAAQETPRLAPVYDRSGVVDSGSSAASSELEKRVARLEKLMENQALVDMLMRLDSLQADTQDLRGQIEDITHELENIKQRQRDLYLDMDRRLRQAELAIAKAAPAPAQGGTVGPAVSAGMAAAAPVAVASVAAATVAGTATSAMPAEPADPAAEREAYQKAFEELKQGRYEQAITAFAEFLKQYPKGEYAGNAQYWLGEANYVTRHFRVAEQEFKKVLEQYPDSPKVADAMLKLGYTYYELGEWDAARQMLTEVVSKKPNSSVARLAENRLQKMRMEGR